MKTYKLIKEYPGSQKLGFVIKKINPYLYGNAENSLYFNINDLIKFKEYWQEVVEKDYEILSFKQNSGINDNWTYFENKKGFCRNVAGTPVTGIYRLEQILNNPLYSIHSVKRKSDGEVFTVGDKITYEVITTGKNRIISSKINKFYIDLSNKLRINFDLDRENINTNCYIKDLIIYKKPLFTTEDGVDIFEGDKTCWINNWTVTNFVDWKRNNNKKELHFSTREAAEEYILMNKPCLSINDVMNVAYNPCESRTSSSRKLKEIVKKRL